MSSKCCYFIRNIAPGVPLDLSKSGESDLLFGEIVGSALGTIEAILGQAYRPVLDNYDQWGRVDESHKTEFIHELKSFIGNISESLNVLSTGLVLKSPDLKFQRVTDPRTLRAVFSPEAYDSYEVLLEEWCNQIESFMQQPTHPVDAEDVGPRWELEYWRSRMQKLTSITEQLKRTECKQVIHTLSLLTKNTNDMSKQHVSELLKRWWICWCFCRYASI
jgi:dynein heavy chain